MGLCEVGIQKDLDGGWSAYLAVLYDPQSLRMSSRNLCTRKAGGVYCVDFDSGVAACGTTQANGSTWSRTCGEGDGVRRLQ
jgi:hypothetical protein